MSSLGPETQTGTTAAVTVDRASRTRTIEEAVEDANLLRSRVGALRGEVADLHGSAEQIHIEAILAKLDEATTKRAGAGIDSLLDELAELGFSWRDIARLVGVSVPALHKWRRGGGATPDHRRTVARVVALCMLLRDKPFFIEDVGSWFEMPVVQDIPITPLDMAERGRVDLVLRWAAYADGDPVALLDDLDADWRDRYGSQFEVFTAPDGRQGIRFRER